MKLTDLSPRWLQWEGRRVAIMFRCPHCVGRLVGNRQTQDLWLTCFFEPVSSFPTLPEDYPIEGLRGSRAVRAMFHDALVEIGGYVDPVDAAYSEVVGCKADCAWTRTSDDFSTVSISPSIDASACGCWHGFITNGEVR